jgi:sulfate adenylyltransferase
MTRLVPPHGGTLQDRVASAEEARAIRARAEALPSVPLDAAAEDDLELVATGAASPLRGFVGAADHRSIVETWRLASGPLWPWPIVLPVDPAELGRLSGSAEVALRDARGRLRGILTVEDAFVRDLRTEAGALFGTESPAHPGVRAMLARPAGALGGAVVALPFADDRPLALRRLSPRDVRALLASRGAARVAALHPRGAPGPAQARLARLALDAANVLLVHPAASAGEAVLAAWDRVARTLPEERVVVAALAAPERRGGAREVLLAALVRKNFGVGTLFVVRPGDELRPVDGLPADIDAAEVGISIVPFAAERLADGGELAA